VLFATLYFIVSLFPILGLFNVYFFRYSFVSDHFQYLAAIGPLALVGAGLGEINRMVIPRWRALAPTTMALILALLGALSWRQTGVYLDAETLYRKTTEQNPGCWLAYTNLGGLYLQQRRFGEAVENYEKAIAINPDVPETQYSLGNTFFASGRYRDAIPHYEAALRTEPSHTKARLNLAVALAATDEVEAALQQFETAVELDPNSPDAHYNLGYTLAQTGHRDEAIRHLHMAVRLQPNYPQAQNQLRVLGAAGP
jgi:tetratricopeptide (TPR) repeat protein